MKKNGEIFIFVESRYKVNRKRIRDAVSEEIQKSGVVGPFEVSVAFVGDRKMRLLNKKYRKKDSTTNILSFSLTEGEPILFPPKSSHTDTTVLRLGDVVISYPQIIKEAVEEEMLVDDKIDQLVRHGLAHLMGIHH